MSLSILPDDGVSLLNAIERRLERLERAPFVTIDPAAPPSGSAGGVLAGSYPNPTFALDMATQAELNAVDAARATVASDLTSHASLGVSAHGGIVADTDPRLTNSRLPTGTASGDLGGTYPSPTVVKSTGAFTVGTTLSVTGGSTFTGAVEHRSNSTWRSAASGVGYIRAVAGTAANAGYIDWTAPSGVRLAYMGYSPTDLTMQLENGAGFVVSNGANTAATEKRMLTVGQGSQTFSADVVNQRMALFSGPSYIGDVAGRTIQTAATVSIAGAPTAGANMAITGGAYSLWASSGWARFDTGIYVTTSNGLSLTAGSGNVAGSILAPTGLMVSRVATGNAFVTTSPNAVAPSTWAYAVRADGHTTWEGDTTLFRDSANVLKTDDAFQAATSLTARPGTGSETYIGLVNGGAGIQFASDTLAQIFRAAAGTTRVTGDLQVGTVASVDSTDPQLSILPDGAVADSAYIHLVNGRARFGYDGTNIYIGGPSSKPIAFYTSTGIQNMVLDNGGRLRLPTQGTPGGLVMGGDAHMWRDAANTIRTNGIFQVGAGIVLNGVTNALTLPANSIGGAALQDLSIPASKLNVVFGGGNLVYNSSFEAGSSDADPATSAPNFYDGWTLVPNAAGGSNPTAVTAASTGVDANRVWGIGSRALRMTATANTQFLYLECTTARRFTVQPGVKYTASAYMGASVTGRSAYLGIRFYDASNVMVPSIDGGDVASASVSISSTGMTRLYLMGVTAPTAARTATIRPVINQTGVIAGEHYYFDGFQVEAGEYPTAYGPRSDEILPGSITATMLQASIIAGDAITANFTITGKRIQTAASPNARVVLEGDIDTPVAGEQRGLKIYDASNVKRIDIDGTNGMRIFNTSGTMGLQSSEGGLVTGLTGSRIEIDGVADQIRFYDSNFQRLRMIAGSLTFFNNTGSATTYLQENLLGFENPIDNSAVQLNVLDGLSLWDSSGTKIAQLHPIDGLKLYDDSGALGLHSSAGGLTTSDDPSRIELDSMGLRLYSPLAELTDGRLDYKSDSGIGTAISPVQYWWFRVAAVDALGNETTSLVIPGTGTVAVDNTADEFKIHWKSDRRESKYRIYRAVTTTSGVEPALSAFNGYVERTDPNLGGTATTSAYYDSSTDEVYCRVYAGYNTTFTAGTPKTTNTTSQVGTNLNMTDNTITGAKIMSSSDRYPRAVFDKYGLSVSAYDSYTNVMIKAAGSGAIDIASPQQTSGTGRPSVLDDSKSLAIRWVVPKLYTDITEASPTGYIIGWRDRFNIGGGWTVNKLTSFAIQSGGTGNGEGVAGIESSARYSNQTDTRVDVVAEPGFFAGESRKLLDGLGKSDFAQKSQFGMVVADGVASTANAPSSTSGHAVSVPAAGNYLIRNGGSGFYPSGGGLGYLAIQVNGSWTDTSVSRLYFNQSGVHMTLTDGAAVVALNKGINYFWTRRVNIDMDSNDRYWFSIEPVA